MMMYFSHDCISIEWLPEATFRHSLLTLVRMDSVEYGKSTSPINIATASQGCKLSSSVGSIFTNHYSKAAEML
ncbi:unnamed protein product [Lepidochelys olivacea]